jgi:hypothetical protein
MTQTVGPSKWNGVVALNPDLNAMLASSWGCALPSGRVFTTPTS